MTANEEAKSVHCAAALANHDLLVALINAAIGLSFPNVDTLPSLVSAGCRPREMCVH